MRLRRRDDKGSVMGVCQPSTALTERALDTCAGTDVWGDGLGYSAGGSGGWSGVRSQDGDPSASPCILLAPCLVRGAGGRGLRRSAWLRVGRVQRRATATGRSSSRQQVWRRSCLHARAAGTGTNGAGVRHTSVRAQRNSAGSPSRLSPRVHASKQCTPAAVLSPSVAQRREPLSPLSFAPPCCY